MNFAVLLRSYPAPAVPASLDHAPAPRARHLGLLRYWRLAAFAIMALGYFALPNARPDFTPFNADDGADYLALAYGLVHGLGYTRSMIAGAFVPHTTWPPGMALLLSPALWLSGDTVNWFAAKATVIATAPAGIAFAWHYVRRLTHSARAADLAALLLALDPFYWHFSRITMTEVPSIAWWLGSLLLIDIVWAGRRPGYGRVALVGLLVGAGMLLKGNLFALALAPLGYLLEARAPLLSRPEQMKRWVVYAAAFGAAFVAWSLRNAQIDTAALGFDGINQLRMIFTKVPVDPTSALMTPAETIANTLFNLRELIIYRVPEEMLPGLWTRFWEHGAAGAFVALALTLLLAYLALPRRGIGMPAFVTLVPSVALLLLYAWGGSARFWLPVTAIALILIAMRLHFWLAARQKPLRYLIVAGVLAAYGLSLGLYVAAHERNPYGAPKWAALENLFAEARDLSPAPVAVLAHHAPAYGLITGQPAPLTVPGLGLAPRYTHVVSGPDDFRIAVPPGAVAVLQSPPWTLYALPRPMRQAEILGEGN